MKSFISDIFKKWQLIVYLSLMMGAMSFFVSTLIPVKYQSEITILIVQKNVDILTASRSAEYLSSVFEQILYTESFMKDVLKSDKSIKRQFSEDARERKGEWASEINSETIGSTGMLKIAVSDPTYTDAEKIATGIGASFINNSSKYHGDKKQVHAKVVDGPITSLKPAHPNITLNTIVGLLIGFTGSIILIRFCSGFDLRLIKDRKIIYDEELDKKLIERQVKRQLKERSNASTLPVLQQQEKADVLEFARLKEKFKNNKREETLVFDFEDDHKENNIEELIEEKPSLEQNKEKIFVERNLPPKEQVIRVEEEVINQEEKEAAARMESSIVDMETYQRIMTASETLKGRKRFYGISGDSIKAGEEKDISKKKMLETKVDSQEEMMTTTEDTEAIIEEEKPKVVASEKIQIDKEASLAKEKELLNIQKEEVFEKKTKEKKVEEGESKGKKDKGLQTTKEKIGDKVADEKITHSEGAETDDIDRISEKQENAKKESLKEEQKKEVQEKGDKKEVKKGENATDEGFVEKKVVSKNEGLDRISAVIKEVSSKSRLLKPVEKDAAKELIEKAEEKTEKKPVMEDKIQEKEEAAVKEKKQIKKASLKKEGLNGDEASSDKTDELESEIAKIEKIDFIGDFNDDSQGEEDKTESKGNILSRLYGKSLFNDKKIGKQKKSRTSFHEEMDEEELEMVKKMLKAEGKTETDLIKETENTPVIKEEVQTEKMESVKRIKENGEEIKKGDDIVKGKIADLLSPKKNVAGSIKKAAFPNNLPTFMNQEDEQDLFVKQLSDGIKDKEKAEIAEIERKNEALKKGPDSPMVEAKKEIDPNKEPTQAEIKEKLNKLLKGEI